ncbi:helix-turn-helix domain-containing protein [Streptomyces sp. DSM 44938]|uniref:Helix-turn-helix domain-containing protein n=1 Tax=Streptomyces litchfieldiae TaxID=3075543 RepID=A0ABU2MQ81_9ACTN|nr:helix-turn-helix domain-containing protein [Streptomyces sp. DSM 44938]MDT0343058.1 helix-turn-helix domain-containing protein [Streptomyces sp. DSM 44938]
MPVPGRPWPRLLDGSPSVAERGQAVVLPHDRPGRRPGELLAKPSCRVTRAWSRSVLAARLLRDSEAPVRSVAERVGYSSEFAFAKAFKREFGLAPGRYRRSCTLRDHRR